MKILMFLSVLVLTIGCASVPGRPQDEIRQLALARLGQLQAMEQLEFRLEPDLPMQRILLAQGMVEAKGTSYDLSSGQQSSTVSSSPAKPRPFGLYFGNGLYRDMDGNIVLRLDRLMGLSSSFRGYTVLNYRDGVVIGGPEEGYIRRATYSDQDLRVTDSLAYHASQYEVPWDKKPLTVDGLTITEKDQGSVVELQHLFLPPHRWFLRTSDSVLMDGQWDSFFWIPFKVSKSITRTGQNIADQDKTWSVEHRGDSLRYVKNGWGGYAISLFKGTDRWLVIEEESRRVVEIRITGDSAVWEYPKGGLRNFWWNDPVTNQYHVYPQNP